MSVALWRLWPLSKVYAYHLSGQQLRKVDSDQGGNFQFERLPAGLYKIIAFKDGFVPAIALLSRTTSEAFQYLRLELYKEDIQQPGADEGFWAVREKIPGDVLREIEIELAADDTYAKAGVRSTLAQLRPRSKLRCRPLLELIRTSRWREASVAGGRIDIEGAISSVNVGLTGDYATLQPVPGGGSGNDLSAEGRSQNISPCRFLPRPPLGLGFRPRATICRQLALTTSTMISTSVWPDIE